MKKGKSVCIFLRRCTIFLKTGCKIKQKQTLKEISMNNPVKRHIFNILVKNRLNYVNILICISRDVEI